MTSEKFLGSEMKCDTSETDSTKSGNGLFNYLKMALNNLYEPLPILFTESYATSH